MNPISKFHNLIGCVLLLVGVILISCNESAQRQKHKPVPINQGFFSEIDSTKLEDLEERSIKYYIDFIARYNEYHADHVGFAGSKSEIYKSYEMMREHMDLDELFPLLKHESEAVRVYAYFAIEYKDSTQKDKAWSALKGKKDKLFTLNGCIGITETVTEVVKGLEMYEQKQPK